VRAGRPPVGFAQAAKSRACAGGGAGRAMAEADAASYQLARAKAWLLATPRGRSVWGYLRCVRVEFGRIAFCNTRFFGFDCSGRVRGSFARDALHMDGTNFKFGMVSDKNRTTPGIFSTLFSHDKCGTCCVSWNISFTDHILSEPTSSSKRGYNCAEVLKRGEMNWRLTTLIIRVE